MRPLLSGSPESDLTLQTFGRSFGATCPRLSLALQFPLWMLSMQPHTALER
jgi:hypothetical protein